MIINCPKSLSDFNRVWKIFLAGPIQGGPDWQNTMPEIDDIVWLSPRRPVYPVPNFNYSEQVQWETDALRMANIVIFWIPEPTEDISGRSYAQTTRFELGENLARGKRIILGAYKDFPGRKYLVAKAEKYDNVVNNTVYGSLEEIMEVLRTYLESIKPTTLFSSDPHFSSDRALVLSKRPFHNTDEMDWKMIENWNNKVNPCDTIYHLGDFGETWPLEYLTGDIKFIPGNYEREGKCTIDERRVEVLPELSHIEVNGNKFLLNHEPISCKENKRDDEFCIFGHIHGRQKIKPWGGLDVGVDCNNFSPVSLEEVLFYKEAVEKGYYDDEVYC